MSSYESIRAQVQATGQDARVEVNQRALIDKILARYASANAVYRELLQNSNDAEADTAEIHFTTTASDKKIVQQVLYRNNGIPFREQDWSRLIKIAEGNPDVSKIGAFGVGAYTMFSICEEPLVISGTTSLCFLWKGDALWCKTAPLVNGGGTSASSTSTGSGTATNQPTASSSSINNKNQRQQHETWTTFVLPSRDPYPLPNLIELGEFLCASLTFTNSLKYIRVFVNDLEQFSILKTLVQEPRFVVTSTTTTPSQQTSSSTSLLSSSWWGTSTSTGAITSTSSGIFYLNRPDQCIYESIYRFTVSVVASSALNNNHDNTASTAYIDARYIHAIANTRIPTSMAQRMERVTKKQPPNQVTIQIFLNAQQQQSNDENKMTNSKKKKMTSAEQIIQSFSPSQQGTGRIFIGFRTSQTTGLGAHVAAPFIPTVEREAMDLQDPSLKVFNIELLEMSGMLMRFTLEHTMMNIIQIAWNKNRLIREQLEQELIKQEQQQQQDHDNRNKGLYSKMSTLSSLDSAEDDENDNNDNDDNMSTTTNRFFGFARFMARGVKKRIVQVVNTVERMIDEGPDLLNPSDPRPLSTEEEDAIVLMQSFCPIQSTPDPLVGTALAQGFARCLPKSLPPVLTRTGVVRGNDARLPHYGMEAFVNDCTVRSVVFKNAEEYHLVIAGCSRLSLNDLLVKLKSTILEEAELIRLLQWFTRFGRVDPKHIASLGPLLKDAIRYYGTDITPTNQLPDTQSQQEQQRQRDRPISALSEYLFIMEDDSIMANSELQLPIPPTVMPKRLREAIGGRVLSDAALRDWFSILPIEIWSDFVAHHPIMTEGKPEDEYLRVEILSIMNKEYHRRSFSEREIFGGFCRSLLADKKCLPFDSDIPTQYAAEYPSNLYLHSADLKAFQAVGTLRKVSNTIQGKVSEEFLLCLGVRKSVSVDFLFQNLASLQWASDPKSLVEYLRTATLTRDDLVKLGTTKYLPADNDTSNRLYAPSELFLPNACLQDFPFVTMLRWPSETELSPKSENGKFLIKLGMKYMPPLTAILEYVSGKLDDPSRGRCLDFLCDGIGPHGTYYAEYNRLVGSGVIRRYRFLPCVVRNPLVDIATSTTSATIATAATTQNSTQDEKSELNSPASCYTEESCSILGFPVLAPSLGRNRSLYGSLFRCQAEPEPGFLLQQFLTMVSQARDIQKNKIGANAATSDANPNYQLIESVFSTIFSYLSRRASSFDETTLSRLRKESFIPVRANDRLDWFRANQVFFRQKSGGHDTVTGDLFPLVEYSPFLSVVGVKQEATTAELFSLMISSPQHVLGKMGEVKYRALLRRIAANPPFKKVTAQIKEAEFLLAYSFQTMEGGDGPLDESTGGMHLLGKASSIYIIDNSFFGRMFPVYRAPHESDLEDFYISLGSSYISESVNRRFEVVGKPSSNTALTNSLKERLNERAPLLVSPNITTRPLVTDAVKLLDENNLTFMQVSNVLVVYSLGTVTRRSTTTCFSRKLGPNKNSVYVTEDLDFFDVGYAIGDIILVRCQLEDAFFISSLLEAPLEQLRARGFPVDRIIQTKPLEPEPTKPPTAPESLSNDGPIHSTASPPSDVAAASTATLPRASAASAQASTPAQTSTPPNNEPKDNSAETGRGMPEPESAASENSVVKGPSNSDVTPTESTSTEDSQSPSGIQDVLRQMFPEADEKFINAALGSNPTMENVQALAEQMVSGAYPKTEEAKKKKGGLFGRFRGKPPSPVVPAASMAPIVPTSAPGAGAFSPPTMQTMEERTKPVSAAADMQSQKGLQRLLENSVRGSSKVQKDGMLSSDSIITSMPDGLDRGETCEVVPGHSLKPYPGLGRNGKTRNGLRVFSSSAHASSELFLRDNNDVVESFAIVLEHLCGVYGLSIDSVAIFHDPAGGTIAFNSNKALHFNVRFFHALHYTPNKRLDIACYSYWFVTTAHELAHHLVSAHNKEHGFYTEAYTSHFLPKLISLLLSLQNR